MKKIILPFLYFSLFTSAVFAQTPRAWTSVEQPLKEMDAVRKLIQAPTFKNQDFIVTKYGAKGDGTTNNTTAFKKAIEACNKAGGGRVVVPAGKYFSGPIYLKSNVNFHVEEGATIIFSRDTKDYPIVLTRWEGMDCMNYSPQIYAYKEENIALTGTGVLDGNADATHWWPWKGRTEFGWKKGDPNQFKARDTLHVLMHNQVDPRKRVFGDGHYLRPNLLAPYQCKNVLISGVKMINSPMWFMSPVMCDNVTIDGVRVNAKGPNTDGCDPDACKNVWIKNCSFDTGDDCIAIKSGRDEDGRKFGRPAENHIIENCMMKDGHGGITIGSEIAGGAKNIYAQNCQLSSPDLNMVMRIKTSSSRGGTIENIFMKDIEIGTFKEAALHCTMFYEKPGNFIPKVRNIWIENVTAEQGGDCAVFVRAYKESPVQNLKLVNWNIKGVKKSFDIDNVKDMQLQKVIINDKEASLPNSVLKP
ncbi:glycoside hydrolase family 28 protein [Pedobacter sp. MW01-1-1]|uniref:glycoside hydrolase family 28 protein n=1 Tax=Pedobacter sp. MW01-1-1 TaxID=3383027 RepID=UPI003FEDAD35